ncbi:MAG: MaoC/PaaZ C-terminal domain-containing protein [Microthrixaceae bacterium]
MPINPEAVGTLSDPQVTSWTSKDSLLYAVGVGAGQDPTDKRDLPFVTENSNGVKQAALPTQAVTLVDFTPAFVNIGSFNPAMLVHGEQKVVLHQQVPAEGSASSTCEISAIWDKGKGAVVELTSRSVDPETGEPLFDMVMSAYIRGEGGWGGDRGPTGSPNAAPEREPDLVLSETTRPEQAFIYRLSGDRNPLHSDPTFAAFAGFDRPILHGLCTYGFAGRALLHALCDSDPARMGSIEGRFSSPVFPGETLGIDVWNDANGAVFRVRGDDDRVVFDAGRIVVKD